MSEKLSEILEFSVTELEKNRENKTQNRERIEAKRLFKNYLIEYFSQYNTEKSITYIYTFQRREIARGRLVTASHVL